MADPWDERYICLHEWLIFMVSVNIPHMDPMGKQLQYESEKEKKTIYGWNESNVKLIRFIWIYDLFVMIYDFLCDDVWW